MRNAFIDELIKLAKDNQNIALVVGDLGYSVVEPFEQAYPNRYLNAGVAEQNMTGLAAGMASEGFHVFTYSIANFPTFRCAEQIRNDVAYHNVPVTVVAIGGGVAYGSLGYSHHAVQDYALMRAMPNMLLASPGDPNEVRSCLQYLSDHPQPSYLRLNKAGEPTFHKELPKVEPGRWLKVSEGRNSRDVILTTGATLALAMQRQKNLFEAGGPVPTVFSMPLWGMGTKSVQAEQLQQYDKVTTIEDHLVDGGFGSWLMESVLNQPELLQKIHIEALSAGVCGTVGSQVALNAFGGLAP